MSTPARVLAGIAFLAVALGILLGGHGYIARRLVLDPGIAEPARSALLGVIYLGLASLVAQPIAERLIAPPWNRLVDWQASLWMGTAFLLLVALGAGDLLRFLAGGVAYAAGGELPDATASARAQAATTLGVVGIAGAFALVSGLRPPRVARVEIALARWPRALDGFRIAQISDIHIGQNIDRAQLQRFVARVNDLAPDLIGITGDIADSPAVDVGTFFPALDALRATYGVLAMLGNHDHYAGAERVVEALHRFTSFTVLRDQHTTIDINGTRLHVVGLAALERQLRPRSELASRKGRRSPVL